MHLNGSQVKVSKLSVFLSLKVILILANSADPDGMQHYAAFHLGLHCLPEYWFMEFSVQMVKSAMKTKVSLQLYSFLSQNPWIRASLVRLPCVLEQDTLSLA